MSNHLQMRKGYAQTFLLFLGVCCLTISTAFSQIIYSDFVPDKSISLSAGSATGLAPVDLDNNGVTDFTFRYTATDASGYSVYVVPANANEVIRNSQNEVVPFSSGQNISETPVGSLQWSSSENLLTSETNQNFAIGEDRFIAVHFQNSTQWLYGWIRVNIASAYPVVINVKDAGYQSNPALTNILANQNIQSSAIPFLATPGDQILEFSEINPTQDFFSCGSTKSIKLTVKPQVANLTGKIKINISDLNSGLFFADGVSSNTSAVTVDRVATSEKEVVLVLQNLSSNAEITLPVFAAYCNIFSTTELVRTFNNVFGVDNGLVIASNLNITINKGATLLLLDASNPSPTTIRTTSPDNTGLTTFQFALKNNSSSNRDFDGWILFQESQTSLGNAFDIRAIKYFLYNPNTQTESLLLTIANPVTNSTPDNNDNSFITDVNSVRKPVNVTIPQGYTLVIREEVRVNGCMIGNDKSFPIISWGCGDLTKSSATNCTMVNNIDTKIVSMPLALFEYDHAKSSYYHTYSCADNYERQKYVTYKNTGNGIAYNTRLKMVNDNWTTFLVEKDVATIYIEITRNGVTQRYQPNLTNYDLPIESAPNVFMQYPTTADLPPPIYIPQQNLSIPGMNPLSLSYGSASNYDVNGAITYQLVQRYYFNRNEFNPINFSYDNVACHAASQAQLDPKRFIWRLVVDEYLDPVTGTYKKINLNPGDEVTLGWTEYKCCNSASNAAESSVLNAPGIYIKFNNGCIPHEDYAKNDYYTFPTHWTGDYFYSQMKIENFNPTTRGDVDWCKTTQDGMVERISTQFTGGLYIAYNHWKTYGPRDANGDFYNTDEPYQNWTDGDLVFRVMLENGLDLDQALSGALASGFANVQGYNNVNSQTLVVDNNQTGCDQNCDGCTIGNTISSVQNYVAIRKGNTVLRPYSVNLVDFNTDHEPSTLNDNFRFRASDGTEQYASNIYEVRFRLSDILTNSPTQYTNHTERERVHDFMSKAFLDLDVRTYCSSNSYPYFKIISLLDKCGSSRTCDLAKNGLTSMQPLAQVSGKFLVNCPGCLIPGANANAGRIYREVMGYLDNNDDGVADDGTLLSNTHPNSRMISNGDVFVIDFSVVMSDGIDKDILDANGRNKGALKGQLDAVGYNLDNLYVNIPLPGSPTYDEKYTVKPLTAEASIDGGLTWKPMMIHNQRTQGYLLLQVNSTAFSSTKTSFSESENILIRFRGIMGYLTDRIDNVEITYIPGFSTCDNCTDMSSFIIVNGVLNAKISSPLWPTNYMSFNDLITQNQTFLLCTTGSNNFKYIPHSRAIDFSMDSDQPYQITCEKRITLTSVQNYSGANSFPSEVRNSPDSRVIEFPIPAGFEVSNLYLRSQEYNDENQKFQNLNSGEASKWWKIYQEFNVTNADFSQYPNAIQIVTTGNPSFPTKIVLTLKSTSVPELALQNPADPTVFDANKYRLNSMSYSNQWIDDQHPLVELDEQYHRLIYITIRPVVNSCVASPGDIIYRDDNAASQIKGNLGTGWFSILNSWAPYYLDPMPSTASNAIRPYSGHEYFRMRSPRANMEALPAVSANFTISNTGIVQVPVLVKLNYVDGTNRYSAQYPFLHIKGDAIKNGLILRGVYRSSNNQFYTDDQIRVSGYTGVWNQLAPAVWNAGKKEYIVPLDQHMNTAADVPSITNREPYLNYNETYFSMVFSYDCNSCTNLIGTSCSDQSEPDPATCLSGNNLQVAYGYNCGGFPSITDIQNNQTCHYYQPIDFSIKNQKVYVQATNFINDIEVLTGQEAAVVPCSTFKYKVQINSCLNGGVTAFDIGLALPAGYSILSTSPAPTSVDNNVYSYSLAPGSIQGGGQAGIRNVEFIISSPCRIGENDKIVANVSATTYCGQPIVFNPVETNLKLDNNAGTLTSAGIVLDNFTINASELMVNGTELSIPVHIAGTTVNNNSIKVDVIKNNTTTSYLCDVPVGSAGTFDFFADCGSSPIMLTPDCSNPYTISVSVIKKFIPSCSTQTEVCENVLPAELIIQKNITVQSTSFVNLTTNGGSASFLCTDPVNGTPQPVELKAYFSGVPSIQYDWYLKTSSNPDVYTLQATHTTGSTSDVYSTSIAGQYKIVATDVSGCSAENYGNVVSQIGVICPEPICPNDKPAIQVSTQGIVGYYSTQWYSDPNGTPSNLSDDILWEDGIPVSGYYYAAAITPSCTLRTNLNPELCNIVVKPAPAPYDIKIWNFAGTVNYGDFLGMCSNTDVAIKVMNPLVNNLADVNILWADPSNAADKTDLSDFITHTPGLYSIMAIDKVSGCATLSNPVDIHVPEVRIDPVCGADGQSILLRAGSNFSTQASDYTWKRDGVVFATGQSSVSIDASLSGHDYTVELPASLCNARDGFYVPNPLPLHATSSSNLVTNGNFEDAIDYCNPAISPDLGCLDPADVLTNITNPNGPDNTFTLGKYFVDNSSANASLYNPNWTGTAKSGSGFMLVDGISQPNIQRVWQKTLSVQHGNRYFLRAHLRNLDLGSQFPVRALPELDVVVTYLDASGIGITPIVETQTLALNASGINQWIVSSGITLANARTNQSIGTGEAVTANIQIIMKNGGAIGRDIGIDEIEFWQVGICDDPTAVVTTGILPCELAEIPGSRIQEICAGETTANFYISGYNPSASVHYDWYQLDNQGVAQLMNPAPTVTNSVVTLPLPTTGTQFEYMLRVSSPSCLREIVVHVKRNNTALTITPIANQSCGKAFEATLTSSVLYNGINYEWMVNNQVVTTTSTNQVVLPNIQNGDVVKCRVSNVFCGPVVSNSITASGLTVAADAGADRNVCQGTTTTLGNSSIAGYTYSWSPSTGLSDPATSSPVFTPDPNNLGSALSYTLTVTNTSDGCSVDDVVVLNTRAWPDAPTVTNFPTGVCVGNTASFTIDRATGFSYLYSTPYTSGNVGIPDGTGPYTVSGLAVGQGNVSYIEMTVTSDATGCSRSVSTQFPVNPIPVVSGFAPTAYTCKGGTYPFEVANHSGSTYAWSVNNGASIASGQGTSQVNIAFPNQGTPVDVTIIETSVDGCVSDPYIYNGSSFDPTISLGTNATICAGESVILDGPNSLHTYSWVTNPAGEVNNMNFYNGPGKPTVAPAQTTVYTLNGTLYGCSASASVTVTVKPLPTSQFSTTALTYCQNVQGGISRSSTPNATTTVFPAGINRPSPGGTGGPGYVVDFMVFDPVTVPTTYNVVGLTIQNGCTTSVNIPVTVNPLPVQSISVSTSAICTGNTITLQYNHLPNTLISWTGPPLANQNGGSTPTGFGIGGNANTQGSHQATLTSRTALGCTSTVSVPVIVNPTPAVPPVTAGGATTFCDGGSVTLSVPSNGQAVQWNKDGVPIAGATANSYTATTSGSYTATRISAANCTATSTATVVTVNPIPDDFSFSIASTTLCQTGSTVVSMGFGPQSGVSYSNENPPGSAVLGGGGGPTGYGYSLQFNQPGIQIVRGIATVTATGCQRIKEISVTVNPNATIALTSAAGSNVQARCFGTAITPITYTVGGGGTDAAVTNLPAGITSTFAGGILTIQGTATVTGTFNYTVNTTGTCNQTTATGTITINPLPTDFSFTSTPNPVCEGGTLTTNVSTPQNGSGVTYVGPTYPAGTISLGGGGNQSGFGHSVQINVATGFNISTTATVTATGCQRIKTIAIAVNPKPSFVPNVTTNSYNCGTNQYNLAAASPVGGTYNFKWYDYALPLYNAANAVALGTGPTFNPTIGTKTFYAVNLQDAATGCYSDVAIVPVQNKCKALQFDGVDDVVTLASPSTNLFSPDNNGFTYEVFFAADAGGGSDQILFTNRSNGTTGVTVGLQNGKPYVKFGSSTYGGTQGSDLRNGACHHLAITRTASPTKNLIVYLDGVSLFSASSVGSVSLNNTLTFGKASNGPAAPFKGRIDEVRVWTTNLDLTTLGQFSNSSVILEANLAAVWMFIETNDQLVRDNKYGASGTNNAVYGTNITAQTVDPSTVNYVCATYLRAEEEDVVENMEAGLNISVIPNPFDGEGILNVSGAKSETVSIIITDVTGRIVYESKSFPNNSSMKVGEGLSAEMHFVKIIDGENVKQLKFIKVK